MFLSLYGLKLRLNVSKKLTTIQIADAYHIGWQRFNHPETKKELILFGKTCAETWTDPVKKKHYGNYTWPGNKSNMDQYLDNFLNGLITTTPALIKIQTDSSRTIYATTRLENTYAGSLDRVLATRGLFHIRIPDVVSGSQSNFMP